MVDVALAQWDFVHERTKVIDFTDPVSYSKIVLLYRKLVKPRDIWIMLRPFSVHVMAALAGAWVTVTLLLCITETLHRCGKEPKLCDDDASVHKSVVDSVQKQSRVARRSRSPGVVKVTFSVVRSFFLSEVTLEDINTHSGRLVWRCWVVGTMILTVCYQSTLTAFLSVSKDDGPMFSTLQDLLTKQPHSYRWGVGADSQGELITLRTSNISYYAKILEGLQQFYRDDPQLATVLHDQAMVKKVLSEDYVFIGKEFYIAGVLNDTCKIHIVDAGMRTAWGSYILPKGSALTVALSQIIRELQASGHAQKWLEKWAPSPTCPAQEHAVSQVINLSHVEGVLYLLPMGAGLALLVGVAECVINKKMSLPIKSSA